ncbi:MAG TPA: M20/M25/M40 family metallo-hydrolase [Myxococcales bacterium]|jgi:acetylornithine deacetylase/succinyl-diaminopimelate desuccinylase-like protein|nr:M20/M25/M40 family metallo-hydrolase [Myxococcales bacterium]
MAVATTLRQEVTELLQGLIRVDTTNPPGNETAAAELLRDYLEDSGVSCELYAKIPERANLVARIPGRGQGPKLLFLSHTDVVLADPAEWAADPFGGELRAGEVWGRGALDMKGQVAAEAVAIASLAREGFEPAGDLIFAATADEEVGAGFGAQWLCEAHPDAVRADFCINEGSGDRVELGGNAFYLCSVAEKMSAPFRLRVLGRSGHASMPGIADNALVKAAPMITALGSYQPERRLIPEVEALLETVTGERPTSPDDVLVRARAVAPLLAEMVEPLLSMTLTPTMANASQKRNVVPAVCEITVDSRLLPGMTPDEQQAIVREILGEGDYELEVLEAHGGTRSAIDTSLWHAVESWVESVDPGARPAPICVAGFTDSHWFRDAFGTVAYGFFPSRAMSIETAARLIHSADERVPVEDLELGISFLRHAAQSIL